MRREDFTANAPGRLIIAPEGHLAFVPDPLPPDLELTRGTINRTPASGTINANSATTVNLTVTTTTHLGVQTGQVSFTPSVGAVQNSFLTWTVF